MIRYLRIILTITLSLYAIGTLTTMAGMEIFVDMKNLIDVPAEIAKNEKEEQKLLGLIKGKETKLSNASFVDRAPASVVETERAGLAQYREQLASVRAALAALRV